MWSNRAQQSRQNWRVTGFVCAVCSTLHCIFIELWQYNGNISRSTKNEKSASHRRSLLVKNPRIMMPKCLEILYFNVTYGTGTYNPVRAMHSQSLAKSMCARNGMELWIFIVDDASTTTICKLPANKSGDTPNQIVHRSFVHSHCCRRCRHRRRRRSSCVAMDSYVHFLFSLRDIYCIRLRP